MFISHSSPLSPFCPIFVLLFLALSFPDLAGALKCFVCDGICDCQRENQLMEVCAPDAFCYTLKAATGGQIVRKGCTQDCRAVTNPNWQRCDACDDQSLCNQHRAIGPFPSDDCALEEFFSLGLGIPTQKHHRRPYAYQQQQQYRRSLHRYGESGPSQNAGGGGYAQGPRQNDGYAANSPRQNDGYANNGPQQNSGGSEYAQGPRQQQAGPSQNSYLVNAVASGTGSSSSEEGGDGTVSSPGQTDVAGGGGSPSQVSARINAFLDRMSPRSVPIGFPGQGGSESAGPQQNSFNAGGSPQQNSFFRNNGGGPQQNSLPPSSEPRAQGAPGFGGSNAAASSFAASFPSIVMLFFGTALLVMI